MVVSKKPYFVFTYQRQNAVLNEKSLPKKTQRANSLSTGLSKTHKRTNLQYKSKTHSHETTVQIYSTKQIYIDHCGISLRKRWKMRGKSIRFFIFSIYFNNQTHFYNILTIYILQYSIFDFSNLSLFY